MLSSSIYCQWSVDSLINICAGDVTATYGTKTMFVNSGQWELYDINTGNSTTGILSLGRLAIKVAAIKNVALFGGGQYGPYTDPVYTKNVDVYDFNTNIWSLQHLTKAREVGAAAAVGNKIFFAGGRDALTMFNTVDIFNVSSGLRTLAKLSKARTNISVGVNGNKIVFAGGWYFDFSYNRPVSPAVDIYDNATGLWSTAKLSQARQGMSVASVGNKIVFAGGIPNSGGTKRVDIYDVTTNTWSVANLSAPRNGMTVNVVGNKAFFASGVGASNIIDVYDAVANTWSVITMPYSLVSAAGAVIKKQIFYAGGYDPVTYAVSDRVQIYNLMSNSWSAAALSEARAGSNVITVGNTTLFAGGFTRVSYPSTGSKRIDRYDALPHPPLAAITALNFSCFPNPVSGSMQFTAGADTKLPLSIHIYTQSGDLMAAFTKQSLQGAINWAGFKPGQYLLSVRDANDKMIQQMVLKQ